MPSANLDKLRFMSQLSLFSLVDFLAVFAAAIGGAIAARQNRRHAYDVVGVLGLGFASALGGGITRDLVIGHGPPLAFQDSRYLVTALTGAAVGLVLGSSLILRIRSVLALMDAAALGLFAVAGATRAVDRDLGALAALLLGITTAVGGGALRDVLSGRTPRIFERGELYAIVATIAAAAFLITISLGVSRTTATIAGSLTGFVVRLLAVRLGWRTQPIHRA
jgi:uncharacterized membrane protein YeiH